MINLKSLGTVWFAGLLAAVGGSVSIAAEEKRPNFLLIVADDLCWRDLGFTGNPDVQTPNIDRLASEGMQLNGMFTPATTCSPSRHALYMGLYCVRAGAYPNHTRAFDGTHSIFTYLKDAGYRVALHNKKHIGPPETFPYEFIAPKQDQDYAATRDFLTRDTDQPWMLVFASRHPHSPWSAGPKGLYDPAQLTIPPYLHDNSVTRENLADYYREVTALDAQVGSLMEMLEETGQSENTLVMFVSEQGSGFPYGGKWSVYDNGIRVATVCRMPGTIAAGSSSEALVQYPDVAPTFLEFAGVNPASIDTGCADADGYRGFDGRSIRDVLLGKTKHHRKYVFSQHTTVGINGYQEPYPMRAVRDDRYKLIVNLAPENKYWINGIHNGEIFQSWQADAEDNEELAARVKWLSHRPKYELYDLQEDPYETNNVAESPDMAEIKSKLETVLERWMNQQGDEGMATEMKAHSRQNANRQNRNKK